MSFKIHHVCIQTKNYKESLDFYTNILGFKILKETKNFHNREFNTWLELNNFMIELQTAKIGEDLVKWSKSNEGIVHLCFMVDDIDLELDKIKKLGYTNFKIKNNEIMYNVNGEKLFKIKAPEGTEIEIRDSNIQ
ncbi:VOC family protein (plasmid) [Paraclostridium ghonii]|uniref:VOC family protein n=1 Tax=Paraclostridium ghonii TaxID=29358 RepID=UPI00202CB3AB|nr:VOC family protein [Paeniclostridium ghonii]MCM0165104.1 VOC family protein [Paeniclostridium ghonii]